MTLRAGLIGLGKMGKNHARILSSLKGVEFVGSYDEAWQIHEFPQYGPVFDSLQKLLKKGLDYAVVAVPTRDHHKVALKLAEAGVNVLIEKPLAVDATSAKHVRDVFASKQLLGAVGHIERFNPAVREARERLGLLGQVYQICTRRQGPFPDRVLDVGVVKDLSTHDIDISSWIAGQKFKFVSAQISHKSNRSTEDLLIANGKLEQGIITNLVVNWLSPKKERFISIIGENGVFEVDTLKVELTHYVNGTIKNTWENLASFKGMTEGDVIRYAFEKREPLLIEHEKFRDAILGISMDVVTLEEGFENVLVAEAMLLSSQTDKTIKIEYI